MSHPTKETMTYLSVCSGIEAATVAWEPLGLKAIAYSEIDKFPCALLEHYYPTPNLGDMTQFSRWQDAEFDVLVGGTPCQSFSVAGFRKGLADPRGNLLLVYLAIASRYRPDWLVWENVPGVLSTNEGRDFGAFMWALGKLGYGWAYRSLDAQYFNLAQRRERVFVVASSRGWPSAAAVLFERASLRGDLAPSREAGQDVALPLTCRVDRGGEHREAHGNNLIAGTLDAHAARGVSGQDAWTGKPIANPLLAKANLSHRDDSDTLIAHSLRADGFDASEDGTGRGTPLVAVAAPLSAGNGANSRHAGRRREDDTNLVFDETQITSATNRSQPKSGDPCHPLAAGARPPTLVTRHVRRLTPRECERLQGFPDDYTLVPYNGKPAKDSPRYKALGNSMAVPVMRWIGQRIVAVDAAIERRIAA
jgi:DNA (cytosine-5)-methyltransferase 1